jgi:hypothetical protein
LRKNKTSEIEGRGSFVENLEGAFEGDWDWGWDWDWDWTLDWGWDLVSVLEERLHLRFMAFHHNALRWRLVMGTSDSVLLLGYHTSVGPFRLWSTAYVPRIWR